MAPLIHLVKCGVDKTNLYSIVLCVDKLTPPVTTPVHESATAPVLDGTSTTALSLHLDIDKLSIYEVSEPVTEATDTASESRVLAPFSRLHHLNLAQNKVHCSDEHLILLFQPTVFSICI